MILSEGASMGQQLFQNEDGHGWFKRPFLDRKMEILHKKSEISNQHSFGNFLWSFKLYDKW